MVTGCFEYTYVECVIQLCKILFTCLPLAEHSNETDTLTEANEEERGGKNLRQQEEYGGRDLLLM